MLCGLETLLFHTVFVAFWYYWRWSR